LLADEPTASLDQENKENLFDLMKMMNQESQTTVITVTHDLEFAEKHDRLITLKL
jgi:putative ABC transport system ATP-binding protein